MVYMSLVKTKSVDLCGYSTIDSTTQPLSRLQCEVESVNVELKEFHSTTQQAAV